VYARQRRALDVVYSYGVPAVLIAFMVLVIPVSTGAGQFYYGVATLPETVASLVSESAEHAPSIVASAILPVAFLIAMCVGVWLLVRGGSPEVELLAMVLGSMGMCVVIWVGMHRGLNFVYPLNRTAIYMLPLFGLALALGSALAPWRSLAWPLAAVTGVVVLVYASQLRTTYFREWRDEAAIHRLVRRLGMDAAATGRTRDVTAGGSWILEYSTRYYGKRYRLPWLKVLDRSEREKIRPDYYLLTREDAGKVDELRLQVVEKDAFSGTVLARGM
jgi:hypothetical protein